MAIQRIAWTKVSMMGLTLLLGIVGTMLLFYGMRVLIALIVKKGKGNKPVSYTHLLGMKDFLCISG